MTQTGTLLLLVVLLVGCQDKHATKTAPAGNIKIYEEVCFKFEHLALRMNEEELTIVAVPANTNVLVARIYECATNKLVATSEPVDLRDYVEPMIEARWYPEPCGVGQYLDAGGDCSDVTWDDVLL